MVRHEESCEGDWGQEGQESPCRCGDQHDRNREALAVIVKTTAQKFGGPSLAEFANDPPIRKHYAVADAILREFDVTPHIEDMGPAANCHLCVGAGGHEGFDGEWVGCSCQRPTQGEQSDTDLIAWHVEQVEALRPFTRSSAHLKAAMMHAATVRALRAGGEGR